MFKCELKDSKDLRDGVAFFIKLVIMMCITVYTVGAPVFLIISWFHGDTNSWYFLLASSPSLLLIINAILCKNPLMDRLFNWVD